MKFAQHAPKAISVVARTLMAGAILAGLAACGTTQLSRGLNDDGVAQEVVFPEVKDAWLKEGTYPNLENLRKVAPGLNKDQLYALIGHPHFSEGLRDVREWDYLFHLPGNSTEEGGAFVTCQFKVLFDKNHIARATYWLPAACAQHLAPPVQARPQSAVSAQQPAPVAPQAVLPRTVELSADALFAFDRSGADDLLPPGKADLDKLAHKLHGLAIDRLEVIGHADRLGSDGYNMALSRNRAETVLHYLLAHGVSARHATASGRGEAEPKVTCAQHERTALIACLAPNRRVTVMVLAETTQP